MKWQDQMTAEDWRFLYDSICRVMTQCEQRKALAAKAVEEDAVAQRTIADVNRNPRCTHGIMIGWPCEECDRWMREHLNREVGNPRKG